MSTEDHIKKYGRINFDELLKIAKKWHGYDDHFHREVQPDCPDCKAIAKAEGR